MTISVITKYNLGKQLKRGSVELQWNLIRIRKELKLSQKDVAKILGISTDAYGMKERGEVQFKQDEMFILSRYFGLPMEVIFLPRDFGKTEIKEGKFNANDKS